MTIPEMSGVSRVSGTNGGTSTQQAQGENDKALFNYDGGEIGDACQVSEQDETESREALPDEEAANLKNIANPKHKITDSEIFDVIDYARMYDMSPLQKQQLATVLKKANTEHLANLNKIATSVTGDEFQSIMFSTVDQVAGIIANQLNEDCMSDSEKKVYTALESILNKTKTFDKAKQGLTVTETKYLEAALQSSERNVLIKRETFNGSNDDGARYQNAPLSFKQATNQEMIYWVKNAYNDFGFQSKGNKVAGHIVDIALSEGIYNNGNAITKEAIKDFSDLYLKVRQSNSTMGAKVSVDALYEKYQAAKANGDYDLEYSSPEEIIKRRQNTSYNGVSEQDAQRYHQIQEKRRKDIPLTKSDVEFMQMVANPKSTRMSQVLRQYTLEVTDGEFDPEKYNDNGTITRRRD